MIARRRSHGLGVALLLPYGLFESLISTLIFPESAFDVTMSFSVSWFISAIFTKHGFGGSNGSTQNSSAGS